MIQVEGLTRRFGDFTAVDGVSFGIERGEIVGLLGHNGAGKTTIMKMMTGYLEPSAGRVEIDGFDVQAHREAVQSRIGYLPENCPLYLEMPVIDYLEYAALLHGVPEDRRSERIARAIELTDLVPKATDLIGTLSRGYRQRVGVAQALLHEPSILILDEPTNGLDPTQIHHMRGLIASLAESATVILSTHILQEVQATCDRVIIIRSGEKVLDSPMKDLQSGRRLLVALDAKPESATRILNDVASVTAVEHLTSAAGRHEYALTLADGRDPDDAASAVAATAVGSGCQLYALRPEQRDLETIFGQVAAGGEQAHV